MNSSVPSPALLPHDYAHHFLKVLLIAIPCLFFNLSPLYYFSIFFLVLTTLSPRPSSSPYHSSTFFSPSRCSMRIFLEADPLTRLTMEMVAHTLCSDQIQQLRLDFQVRSSSLAFFSSYFSPLIHLSSSSSTSVLCANILNDFLSKIHASIPIITLRHTFFLFLFIRSFVMSSYSSSSPPLSISLSLSLSLSVHLFSYYLYPYSDCASPPLLSLSPSPSKFSSIYLSFYLFIHSLVYPCLSLAFSLSLHSPFIYLFIYLSIYLSVSISYVCSLDFSLSLSLSVSSPYPLYLILSMFLSRSGDGQKSPGCYHI